MGTHDGAAWDLADVLSLSGHIHYNQVPVTSRLWINADVGRAPILIMDSEHDLRVRPAPLEAIR